MFDTLHYHGSCRSSAVAYSRHAVLTRFELMQEGGENSRAGATEGVSERDGTTERVDIGGIE